MFFGCRHSPWAFGIDASIALLSAATVCIAAAVGCQKKYVCQNQRYGHVLHCILSRHASVHLVLIARLKASTRICTWTECIGAVAIVDSRN